MNAIKIITITIFFIFNINQVQAIDLSKIGVEIKLWDDYYDEETVKTLTVELTNEKGRNTYFADISIRVNGQIMKPIEWKELYYVSRYGFRLDDLPISDNYKFEFVLADNTVLSLADIIMAKSTVGSVQLEKSDYSNDYTLIRWKNMFGMSNMVAMNHVAASCGHGGSTPEGKMTQSNHLYEYSIARDKVIASRAQLNTVEGSIGFSDDTLKSNLIETKTRLIRVLFYGDGNPTVSRNNKLRQFKLNSMRAYEKEFCFEVDIPLSEEIINAKQEIANKDYVAALKIQKRFRFLLCKAYLEAVLQLV